MVKPTIDVRHLLSLIRTTPNLRSRCPRLRCHANLENNHGRNLKDWVPYWRPIVHISQETWQLIYGGYERWEKRRWGPKVSLSFILFQGQRVQNTDVMYWIGAQKLKARDGLCLEVMAHECLFLFFIFSGCFHTFMVPLMGPKLHVPTTPSCQHFHTQPQSRMTCGGGDRS